jgi:peptidoglycan/xylan/chitin deacetylase (PgdA/CDA1 family)
MKITKHLRILIDVLIVFVLLLTPASAVYAAASASTNLISNPLLETPSSTNASQPQSWTKGAWGSNKVGFNYLNSGSTGDTNSVNVTLSNYTSGAAEWYFSPVAVTAGSNYNFNDSYTSTTSSEVDAVYTLSNGTQDYVYLTTLAPSASWLTYKASLTAPAGAVSLSIFHMIYSNGSLTTDNFGLTLNNGPAISITGPTANAIVSGTQQLTANASDSVAIKNVQFAVDGTNVGNPVTSSPYQMPWNSNTVTNGNHTIAATVTDANNQTATTSENVNVSNAVTTNGNVVPNPSLSQVNPSNSSQPENWQPITWGNNTTNFSYANTGYDDTNSVKTQITSYTTGSSEWMFGAIPVNTTAQYKFSDYYESNIPSEVEVMFNMSDGTQLYQELGFPLASTTWKQFTTDFNAPAGAVSFSVYQYISQVGYVTTDDYSIAPYNPVPYSRALVSLTFDDGYSSTFTNAIPLLKKEDFTSTQFIITDAVGESGYVTAGNIKTMAGDGEEIASHTVTHDDMTQETASQLKTELANSQTKLTTWSGQSITDMAYPYGLYNSAVTTATAQYYSGARGVEPGLNSKDNFNPQDLKVENVFDTTTTAQISSWIAEAQATNTWLILVYHSVSATPTDDNNVTPAQLSDQLAAIKASGITVENMNTALKEVQAQ